MDCAVCLGYYEDPRNLECSHSFCFSCLKLLVKNGKIECPACRETHEIPDVDRLKKNYPLVSLIEEKKAKEAQIEKKAKEAVNESKQNISKVTDFNTSKVNMINVSNINENKQEKIFVNVEYIPRAYPELPVIGASQTVNVSRNKKCCECSKCKNCCSASCKQNCKSGCYKFCKFFAFKRPNSKSWVFFVGFLFIFFPFVWVI